MTATSTFAADKKKECEQQVRSKANSVTQKKVDEMEKKKAKYNRELLFAETKRELLEECMKKK